MMRIQTTRSRICSFSARHTHTRNERLTVATRFDRQFAFPSFASKLIWDNLHNFIHIFISSSNNYNNNTMIIIINVSFYVVHFRSICVCLQVYLFSLRLYGMMRCDCTLALSLSRARAHTLSICVFWRTVAHTMFIVKCTMYIHTQRERARYTLVLVFSHSFGVRRWAAYFL